MVVSFSYLLLILFSGFNLSHGFQLLCPEGLFLCGNGRCIENVKVCDGFLDCNDEEVSDESLKLCSGVKRQKCPGIKIYCPNTNICLWPFELCDGTNNCGDYADENLEFCTTHKCSPNQVQCPNGRCVPEEWFCNGKILCQNETWENENIKCSDENGKKACFGANAFKCNNGKCLSRLGLCDGVDQCGDGSDESAERNCGNRTCLSHEFYCHSNAHRTQFAYECIPKSFTCDGSADCPEGEDEMIELCGKSQNVSCTKYEFQCSSKQCVPAESECNGVADCFDNSGRTLFTVKTNIQ
uniref:Uncharacterized protein n=1 Tax=Panagrolaimus davidi TaxID=227884 RepID=A0A914PYI9_9BILA